MNAEQSEALEMTADELLKMLDDGEPAELSRAQPPCADTPLVADHSTRQR